MEGEKEQKKNERKKDKEQKEKYKGKKAPLMLLNNNIGLSDTWSLDSKNLDIIIEILWIEIPDLSSFALDIIIQIFKQSFK